MWDCTQIDGDPTYLPPKKGFLTQAKKIGELEKCHREGGGIVQRPRVDPFTTSGENALENFHKIFGDTGEGRQSLQRLECMLVDPLEAAKSMYAAGYW